MNHSTLNPSKDVFSSLDYVVMISSFAISTILGSSYFLRRFATKGGVSSSARDYFMTEGSMGLLPVTLSLIASRISPLTTLGYPVEVYSHGISIWFFVIGEFLGCVFAAAFCLPVFFPLEFDSINELLEGRFRSRALRFLCAALYAVKIVMYLGVVLYGPAVALHSTTPLSIDASIAVCGVLCCLYTALGGLRGVVWTDVFQFCVIVGAQVTLLVMGLVETGGVAETWRISEKAGRIKLPETKFDMHSRHSFWNIILAPTLEWTMQMGAAQMAIQRLKSLRSAREAAFSLVLTGLAVVLITTASMACGLVITAKFINCDPMSTGEITNDNQYLPYLALTIFSKYPGLTGFFVAAIFSASLSSISSGVNAVANVVWDDFLRQSASIRNMSETSTTFSIRLLSLLVGAVPVAIAFAAKDYGDNVQKMGTVFVAVTMGATNAVFLSCFFVRRINVRGLMVGCLASVAAIGWWVIGGTVHSPPVDKLTSNGTADCEDKAVFAEKFYPTHAPEDIDWSSFPYLLYNMSFLWYQSLGTAIALAVAFVISLVSRGDQPVADEFLFSFSKFTTAFKRQSRETYVPVNVKQSEVESSDL